MPNANGRGVFTNSEFGVARNRLLDDQISALERRLTLIGQYRWLLGDRVKQLEATIEQLKRRRSALRFPV